MCLGVDIHESKARTSMTPDEFKKLWSEKLAGSFFCFLESFHRQVKLGLNSQGVIRKPESTTTYPTSEFGHCMLWCYEGDL